VRGFWLNSKSREEIQKEKNAWGSDSSREEKIEEGRTLQKKGEIAVR